MEVPAALLNSDEKFARLMEEAEKYVGFPYVWGGSTPETSFDCSGFVSYVLTNSGLYNTGRLGAQGLLYQSAFTHALAMYSVPGSSNPSSGSCGPCQPLVLSLTHIEARCV